VLVRVSLAAIYRITGDGTRLKRLATHPAAGVSSLARLTAPTVTMTLDAMQIGSVRILVSRGFLATVAATALLLAVAGGPDAAWATFPGPRNGALVITVYFCSGCSSGLSDVPSEPYSYVINVDGSGTRDLGFDEAAFSPSGRSLLLFGGVDRLGFGARLEDSSGRVLVRRFGQVTGWSSRGAFVAGQRLISEAGVMIGRVQVPRNDGEGWSPDGATLAYARSDRDGVEELDVKSVFPPRSAHRVFAVPSSLNRGFAWSWSPGGRAFVLAAPCRSTAMPQSDCIATVESDGSNYRELHGDWEQGSSCAPRYPSWLGPPSAIVTLTDCDGPVLLNRNGSLRASLGPPASFYSPSPRGDLLATITPGSRHARLRVFDLRGRLIARPRTLPDAPFVVADGLVWSPDQRDIAVAGRDCSIEVVPVAGGRARRVGRFKHLVAAVERKANSVGADGAQCPVPTDWQARQAIQH
jgi:hypothetical protein